MRATARWKDFEASVPEFATKVRAIFEAHRHKTIATLRRDGSPRISGTEADFRDGELWFGAMWQSQKALDLRRDPRFALHSGSDDPSQWTADAKLGGRVEEVIDEQKVREINADAPPDPSHLFRADITEAAVARLGDPADHIVIEFWREGQGLKSARR